MWIDIAFAIVVGLAFYQGYSRGIIGTVVSIAALVLGFVVAVRYSSPVTELLADLLNTPPTGALPLLGFVVTFALTLAALRLLVKGVERLLATLQLTVVNKVLGGLAAAVIATFLLGMALIAVESAGLIPREQQRDSLTYEPLAAFPDQVKSAFVQNKPALERLRERGEEELERARERREERRGDRG